MGKEENHPQLEQIEWTSILQSIAKPEKGWIRAIREANGVSAGQLGRILGTSRQLPLQFEKAEADESISLKSLRKVAHALDCELVYALVPKVGAEESLQLRALSSTSETASKTSESEAATDEPYFCD